MIRSLTRAFSLISSWITKRKQNSDKFDDIKEDQCSLPSIKRSPSNKNIEDVVKIKDL